MHNHRAKKHFGQNFLTDKNLLRKIVESADIKGKDVIEIGPGMGALTQFLVKHAITVKAYEIDKSLSPYMNKLKKEHENLEIIYEDILSIEIPNDKNYDVVANIPYNITSPILFKLLESKNINSATLMVQKEVAERITSEPNNKSYNSLSLIVQYYMNVERIMIVKRHMFKPAPNVDSAVFKMTRRKPSLLNEKLEAIFIELVKAAFSQKRKTLVNNWHSSFEITKKELNHFLEENDLDKMVRAENVSLEKFVEITKNWSNLSKS